MDKAQEPRVDIVLPLRVDMDTTQDKLIVKSDAPMPMYMSPNIIPTSTAQSHIESSTESIANQVKSRHRKESTTTEGYIASQVARWCHELANPILDMETGQLLKYRAQLKHHTSVKLGIYLPRTNLAA